MENRRGILLYAAWIMRIIAVIILAALLIFFVVRLVRNQQASKTAEEAVKTATNAPDEKQQSENKESTTKDSDTNRDQSRPDDNSSSLEVPGGVADSDATNNSQNLPVAGLDSVTVFLATFMLSSLAYSAVWFMQSRNGLPNTRKPSTRL